MARDRRVNEVIAPVNPSDHPADGAASIRRLALQGGVLLAIFTTVVFVGIYLRSTWLIRAAVVESASAYIDLVVDTREWNALHGGVWVQKTDEVQENPYLRAMGVDPDTQTVSGSLLTLRNPSAMTSEISSLSARGDGVSFRLTSLKPLNPEHEPDSWERESLVRFERDRAELSRIERGPDERVLTLMRPLITDQSCLRCHAAHGYRVGDVRGAVSVLVPLGPMDRLLLINALTLFALWLMVMVIGGLSMRVLVDKTSQRVETYEVRLHNLATTDPLTGVGNRRAVLDRLETELARSERGRSAVGVVAMDADYFKRVNDVHGHAAGDHVLHELAARVSSAVREYDVVGRTGGEEFLVVAPDITAEGLAMLAERLRMAVADTPIAYDTLDLDITISLGTALSENEERLGELIARADVAMYAAKDAGRNRVVTG